MSQSPTASGLRGRDAECNALDLLLADTRSGVGSVLVLRGQSGSGKTALLGYTQAKSVGCRVVRTGGVESEMELPSAGLQQMCGTILSPLDVLPEPQRRALQIAFGLAEGEPPSRFLVGLAILSLLSEEAADRPLVCLIDDAQWLDRSSLQALAFAARRLMAEPVAIVFAVRDPSEETELDGLPVLAVNGIADGDARRLLEASVQGRLDEQVADRIVAEARGNPLALQELPRGLTESELAGGFALPDARPLASRIEQSFLRQLDALPAATRRLLLTAAAEPVGDAALLWRAAEALRIPADAAAPAEAAGLIELGARIRFRHPLVRSAVYRAASLSARRDTHAALGDATDQRADPDRRAWHRAHAVEARDEEVAGELQASADRAQRRGGVAAAAAFLERATELTPDATRRGERALLAARAKFEAGASDTAYELLATAQMCPLDALQLARLQRLRAQIGFGRSRGKDAPPLLLRAAQELEPLDLGLARATYLEALLAAIYAGRLGDEGGISAAALAALSAPAQEKPNGADLMLDGLALRFTAGYVEAAPTLRRSLAAYRQERHPVTPVCLACCVAAMDLWDDEAWEELAGRQVQLAREAGNLNLLPMTLDYLAGLRVHTGEFAEAASLIEEAAAITPGRGVPPLPYASMILAAWRGDPESKATARAVDDAVRRGEGNAVTVTAYAASVLANGTGLYGAALEAAQKACEADDMASGSWALAELVEAAARTDELGVAKQALERLSQQTRASPTSWALGTEARAFALLADDMDADDLYVEAIDRLSGCRMNAHTARAHLVYGEWLRRQNRRVTAREHLYRAYELFSGMGAEGFAERTRHELLATGETVRKRTVETLDDLTPQEFQIARLAASRQTNAEIGTQLFISSRTVEWHLHKVFSKLGIRSRRDLGDALPGAPGT